MSIVIQVAIARGFHLFPFRTEKLSLVTPMVLRNSGRVGSCRFFNSDVYRALRDKIPEGSISFFVCLCFFVFAGWGSPGNESLGPICRKYFSACIFIIFSLSGNCNRSNRIFLLPENNIKLAAGRFMLEALWTGRLFYMVRYSVPSPPSGNKVWQPGQSFFKHPSKCAAIRYAIRYTCNDRYGVTGIIMLANRIIPIKNVNIYW